MKIGLLLFRIALAVMWVALFWVSAKAVASMGAGAAGAIFFGDMAHPWRAQFNTDFGLHLLLVAAWITWRSRNRLLGLLGGIMAIVFGGVFMFAYLMVLSFTAGGDVRRILVGDRGATAA